MDEWLEQLRQALGEGAEEMEVKIEYEDGTTKKLYFGNNDDDEDDEEDEDEDEDYAGEDSEDEDSEDEDPDDEA
ncbi:DNA primase [Brevibacillus sp. M2.1A]|uniref:DNA primase n=1 Tax=Brevibacillus sp. M2.1A TaxID=2738980 RepID=UPI00156B939E|nr:DNA primase [Brevibacillus sp. M2.1A]MCC8437027.1 DNA primase [Brevibacillus sp. M2.1A]